MTGEELAQRVAVLKRFRELLAAQRDRFRAYLEALDRQKDAIEGGSAEEVAGHVDLEEQIVADITSIQKVINPLEDMYRSLSPAKNPAAASPEDGIPDLKSTLENLRTEAAARSARNRELLSRRMAAVNDEIVTLRTRSPYRGGRSIYAAAGTPSVIDIRG